MTKSTTFDRAHGAFLGLAIGDALGTTLEFEPRRAPDNLHSEIIGGAPFLIEPGGWTDDTSMAICLAASLIEKRRLNPHDLMRRFCDWQETGIPSSEGRCVDIGRTVQIALDTFRETNNPYAGSTDPRYSANGSLMRLAPAAIFAKTENIVADIAIEQSHTTHASPQCLAACDAAARIMWKNIHRTTDAPILQLPSFKSASPEVNQIVCALDTCVPRADVKSTGYVVDTLHAALWSIAKTASFEDALITAVNLGGDADTIGAVTGQIAGSIYGASAIPERWKSKLAMRLYFEKATQDLLNASNEKATRPLTQIAQFAAKIFK